MEARALRIEVKILFALLQSKKIETDSLLKRPNTSLKEHGFLGYIKSALSSRTQWWDPNTFAFIACYSRLHIQISPWVEMTNRYLPLCHPERSGGILARLLL